MDRFEPEPDESRLLTDMEIADAAIVCWPALEADEQASFRLASFRLVAKAQLAKDQAHEQARVEEIFKWVDDIVPLLGLLDLSDLQEKNLQKKLASLQALKKAEKEVDNGQT